MAAQRPTRRRWLIVLLAVSVVAVVSVWLTWASFSITVSNEGNTVTAGTVTLVNGAAAMPLYAVTDRAPGHPLERCVEVTYLGDLPADVRFYVSPVSDGAQVHLELSVGTGADASLACDGFEASGSPLFSGTLSDLAGDHRSWLDGLVIPAPRPEGWTTASSRSVRFRLEQLPADGGAATGAHHYVWEARSR